LASAFHVYAVDALKQDKLTQLQLQLPAIEVNLSGLGPSFNVIRKRVVADVFFKRWLY
jgi:hypothetical protein